MHTVIKDILIPIVKNVIFSMNFAFCVVKLKELAMEHNVTYTSVGILKRS